MQPTWFTLKRYDTHLDRFRIREGIAIGQWAREAGMARSQFNKYRCAQLQPRSNALAALVRAASRILGRSVKASELYDVGEEVPLGNRKTFPYRSSDPLRKLYESPFDRLLRRIKLPPNAAARELEISRQALRRLRIGDVHPVVPSLRQIVSALRRIGYDVKASDIVDVGEEALSL